MKRPHVFCFGLLLSLGLVFVGSSLKAGTAPPDWSKAPSRSNQGEVMFEFIPRGVVDDHFQIEVRVNTHNGDLAALNLQEVAILRVGETVYRPSSPVRLGGHHAHGTLLFELNKVPQKFELVIKSVRSMGDLTFRWP